MHGLINRSIQCFIRDTYGPDLWLRVAGTADLGFDSFEALQSYDDALTDAVLAAAAHILSRSRSGLLEDLGTYLVSHPNLEALRRLLRFGGVDFVDFLHSLDDLPERGRLAVPALDLPHLELVDRDEHTFVLTTRSPHAGFGHVMMGVLRAMADDYGALVLMEHDGGAGQVETVTIQLLDARFAKGRRFDIAARADAVRADAVRADAVRAEAGPVDVEWIGDDQRAPAKAHEVSGERMDSGQGTG